VNQTAGNTRDEERVVDLQLDGVLQRLLGGFEHAVELLSLGDCSWEAVEDEAARIILVLVYASTAKMRV
jgi:hypothetical protein